MYAGSTAKVSTGNTDVRGELVLLAPFLTLFPRTSMSTLHAHFLAHFSSPSLSFFLSLSLPPSIASLPIRLFSFSPPLFFLPPLSIPFLLPFSISPSFCFLPMLCSVLYLFHPLMPFILFLHFLPPSLPPSLPPHRVSTSSKSGLNPIGTLNSIVLCFLGVKAGRTLLHFRGRHVNIIDRFLTWGVVLVSYMYVIIVELKCGISGIWAPLYMLLL